ncbi:hypothetical protein PN497_09190 [Sphaerospermopsis kisseleviana CS-549]|uniref:Transposase n=1 Tax=Sphaerospermopsis kisseleviana CS-549 TaxID=3021783 RepID=A0ABT4ZS11_9CYAN|nr:hypothetical protein [Sphaerospermopsis kisseleviana]MDB9441532.1 hypothetical protein [Sphaerospermopsis kisseleviana CS-549]
MTKIIAIFNQAGRIMKTTRRKLNFLEGNFHRDWRERSPPALADTVGKSVTNSQTNVLQIKVATTD